MPDNQILAREPGPLPSIYTPLIERSVAFEMASQGLRACADAATAAFNAGVAIGGEISRFASERISKDLEVSRDVLGCRTGEDIVRVQSQLLEEALRDYAAEAARVSGMAADAAHETLMPLTNETRSVLHRFAAIPKDNGHFA